jgi:hypothetical protein
MSFFVLFLSLFFFEQKKNQDLHGFNSIVFYCLILYLNFGFESLSLMLLSPFN